jgi:hypothetical protein
MNKILPIILVVVLSGCGGNTKTTLEKCADNLTLGMWNNIYFMESINYSDDCRFEKDKKTCQRFIKDSFLTKPLSKRLTNRSYENKFQGCEAAKSNYPETFDAKWK